MITAGIDCGAKTTKVVVLKDGKIIGKAKGITGFDQKRAIMEAWDLALKEAKVSAGDVKHICGAGSGKNAVTFVFPDTADLVNDIKAMGKGANFFFPTARTVADVGAEEGRRPSWMRRGIPWTLLSMKSALPVPAPLSKPWAEPWRLPWSRWGLLPSTRTGRFP